MALVTNSELKAWANPNMDSSSDTELTRVIAAAQDWIGSVTGRVLEKTAQTAILSGENADPVGNGGTHESLVLPAAHRPIEYSTSFSVTEDGVSLTHTSGYSLSVGVLVKNMNSDKRAELIRVGGWSKSQPNNITVTYNAGYTTSSVPPAVKQLIYEVSWLMFKSPSWIGTSHATGESGGITFEKQLTPLAQWVLNALRSGGVFS